MIFWRKGAQPTMTILSKNYPLRNFGLPVISSLEDFASSTRLSVSFIKYYLFQTDSHYKVYSIPKKNGDERIIAQPSRNLKAIQSWILRNILDRLSSSENSKGFEKGDSILNNALPHSGASYILSIDIEDFFPSISANKVHSVFRSLGYNSDVCKILTTFCTYKGRLPQGAPTSPKLANLVSQQLDARIQGYAGPKGIIYTRYANDLTLSSNTVKKLEKARDIIGLISKSEGLKINSTKTKLTGSRSRKSVTGLIVTKEGVGIGREKYRELRSHIYNLFKDNNGDVNKLTGHLSYVYSVDKRNFKRLKTYINNISKKYPNPSYFLQLSKIANVKK